MKNIKMIFMLIIVVAISSLFACSQNEPVKSDNISTPIPTIFKNVTLTPEAGITQGEMLYNDIPILQFIGADISKVIDVLGEPVEIASRPPSTEVAGIYVYDSLYFHVDDNTPIGYITMSPEVCKIDGSSLNKNKKELIYILGEPISEKVDDEGEYSNSLLLDFNIENRLVRFVLENENTKAHLIEICSI